MCVCVRNMCIGPDVQYLYVHYVSFYVICCTLHYLQKIFEICVYRLSRSVDVYMYVDQRMK